MCKIIEDYGTKRERRILYQVIEKGKASIQDCAEELHMTEAEILDDMEKEGYKAPVMA